MHIAHSTYIHVYPVHINDNPLSNRQVSIYTDLKARCKLLGRKVVPDSVYEYSD